MTTAIIKKFKSVPFIDTVQCGDSARLLKQIPDNCVDLVVTSPPYFQQRSYGWGETGEENSVEGYVDAVLDVFDECVRIIKDTGSVVFNMGDKYLTGNLMLIPYRFAIQAMNEGKVKLVNNITWVKTNPTPRQFQRRLVSSTEPFFHFVKSNNYYYDIDSLEQDSKPSKPSKITTLGNRYDKLIRESNLSKHEKTQALSALSNVVQEVRDSKITGFRMKIRDIHAPAFGGQDGGRNIQMQKNGFTIIRMTGKSIKRDIMTSKVESIKWNSHPAIYPEQVIQHIVKLLTPSKSIIVDPYMGSGTTGVVAKRLNRNFIGFDVNPEYCKQATRRIEKTI